MEMHRPDKGAAGYSQESVCIETVNGQLNAAFTGVNVNVDFVYARFTAFRVFYGCLYV